MAFIKESSEPSSDKSKNSNPRKSPVEAMLQILALFGGLHADVFRPLAHISIPIALFLICASVSIHFAGRIRGWRNANGFAIACGLLAFGFVATYIVPAPGPQEDAPPTIPNHAKALPAISRDTEEAIAAYRATQNALTSPTLCKDYEQSFAETLDCFYDGRNFSRTNALAGRLKDCGGYKTIVLNPRVVGRLDDGTIIICDEGQLGKTRAKKAIGMRRVGGRWKIVLEVTEKMHKCYSGPDCW